MARIVVGVDDSAHADAALRWAIDDAARRGAAVELVHAYVPRVRPGVVSSLELAEHTLDRVVERNRGSLDTVKWSAVLAPVPAGAQAAALAEAGDEAELVVVGSRGLGGFRALLLGSTSYRTAGHAPCPVAVVRRDAVAGRSGGPERIVIGVDGTRTARRALRWALEEAQLRGIAVTVVHGCSGRSLHAATPLHSRDDAEAVIDRALRIVDPPPDVAIDRVVAEGSPAGALLELSDANTLLVVGTRGHGAIGRMLVGSVSHQCLHHAHGPVIVVP